MKTYAYLIVALAILFVAVSGYGLWYHKLGAVNMEVSRLTTEIAQKSYDATQAAAAEKELAKLATQEEQIHDYFVASADIVPFLESLKTVGSNAGSKVSVASVASVATPRPHLDLSLKILGSFDAVLRTIGMIEYSPHDIQVATFALDSTVGEKDTIWTATLLVRVGTASSTATAKPLPKTIPNISTSTTATTSTSTTTP